MKKDGIQTRNRKLSAKSKKKRGSMVDFFAPFDTKSFSAYGGMSGHHAASSYLTNPMSQYYGTQASAMAASSFMSASPTSMASMYSSANHMLQHTHQGSVSPASAQSFLGASGAAVAGVGQSGSNNLSPSIIGAMT